MKAQLIQTLAILALLNSVPNLSHADCLAKLGESGLLKGVFNKSNTLIDELREFNSAQGEYSSSIQAKNHTLLVTHLNKQLSLLLKEIAIYCRTDRDDEFYTMLIQYLKSISNTVQDDDQYEVIVIGGGVSGTAAALALGPEHRVLVLEKNEEWPSVFGNSGSFFLNAYPGFQLKNSPVRYISDLITPRPTPLQDTSNATPAMDASVVGKNLLIDLFYSGADALLKSPVKTVQAIGTSEKPMYQVTTVDKRTFQAPHVVFATGWSGINTDIFKNETKELIQKEMAKSDGAIRDVDTFLAECKKDPQYPEKFAQKKVAVIGGGDGGSVAVMGLLGYRPGLVHNAETILAKTQQLKKDSTQIPFSIDWIGRKEMVPENKKLKPEGILAGSRGTP